MRLAVLIVPIVLTSILLTSVGCSHAYRKAYRFEAKSSEFPTAQLRASFELDRRALRGGQLRFITTEFFDYGKTCPASGWAMNRKIAGGRYLGTIDLVSEGDSGALTIPAGGFLVVTNLFDDRHLVANTYCRVTSGFVPRANESYELLFRIGTGSCVIELRDADGQRVPMVGHDKCEEYLRFTAELAAEVELAPALAD